MMLSDLRYRLRAVFRRDRMETELDDELRFHFEHEAEKYRRSGLSDEEAQRRARMALGGHEQVMEDCREARGTSLAETLVQDVRYGLRVLRKSPGFTVTAAVTLALGIGACTAVFSLVDTILLKPLPYTNADRAVMVWREAQVGSYYGSDDLPWTSQELLVFAQTATAFRNPGAFRKKSFNLTGGGEPQLAEGVEVSAGFFPALGVSPLLGRAVNAQDDQPGHERVAVLSERLWQTRYHGDSAIVGRSIDVNGYPYTVIGVMPARFVFPDASGMPANLDVPRRTELWVPMALPPGARGSNDTGVVADPKAGATIAQMNENLAIFEKRMEEQNPAFKGSWSRVVPLTRQAVTDTKRPLLLWMGAVCVVLLIACSNVAGLTLNRSVGRRRELTLRGALGARRGRLIRQLMIENLLLACAGGALGIVLGAGSLELVKIFGPANLPHLQETGLNLQVAAFALAATLGTGLLFGLAPALSATRTNMVEALKEGGQRAGGGVTAPRIRNGLLVVQVALAMVLVAAAGLLLRTFYEMLHADAGFDSTHVVTFELPLPPSRYSDTDRMAQVYQQVLERLQAMEGVQAAGFASEVPMGGETDSTVIRIPGRPTAIGAGAPGANYLFVSPGFFAAMGTPLQRGRDVRDDDVLPATPVAVINRTMAERYWPGQDPLGKQVGVGLVRIPARTIVGVAADAKQTSLREPPAPAMYVPYTQNEIKTWPSMQSMEYAIRLRGDAAGLLGRVRAAVDGVDPDLPIANFAALTTLVDASMTADRFAMLLLCAFGLLALALAAIGMYGVIAYTVMQRTAEIGIRVALGAGRGQILGMILRQGGTLAGAGIALGLGGAWMTTHALAGFLYGVRPGDPVTLAAVAGLLGTVAVAACYVPARRAMRVDPMVALRYE